MRRGLIRVAGAAVLAAAAMLGLSAASGDAGIPAVGDLPADASAGTAKQRLGACQDTGEIDHAPPFVHLADVDRWVEVRGLDREAAAGQPADRHATLTLQVQTVRPGAERAGDPRTEPVVVHGSVLPGVEWALRSGGRAFLALGPERVRYALVETAGGAHLFAGDCQDEALTRPVDARLGDRADAVLHGLVGETGRTTILARLGELGRPA